MWPIPSLDDKIVTVLFSPDALVCAWIDTTSTGTAPLVLRAYKRYPLHNYELEKLIIFNPTLIKKYINSFVQYYDLQNAFIVYCLHGPAVVERYVPMTTSTPHHTDFGVSSTSTFLWEYRYMYLNDHGQHVFYLYSIARSVMLQYQLLAVATKSNLITMTTKTMALVAAYKNIFGVAFRRAQFGIDMARFGNNVEELISVDTLRRMITIAPDINLMDEKNFIATACGLFCAERNDR